MFKAKVLLSPDGAAPAVPLGGCQCQERADIQSSAVRSIAPFTVPALAPPNSQPLPLLPPVFELVMLTVPPSICSVFWAELLLPT